MGTFPFKIAFGGAFFPWLLITFFSDLAESFLRPETESITRSVGNHFGGRFWNDEPEETVLDLQSANPHVSSIIAPLR